MPSARQMHDNDTILVLTSRDDLTADAVVHELTGRGQHVVRLDTTDFPTAVTVHTELGPTGWTGTIDRAHAKPLRLERVKSVWWRRPGEFRTPDTWPDAARAWATSEARAGLLGVLGSLPVRWINHPAADSAANYKPGQLASAARIGLRVPRSTITSDPARAREFITSVADSGAVIYKPMGGGHSRTGRISQVPPRHSHRARGRRRRDRRDNPLVSRTRREGV